MVKIIVSNRNAKLYFTNVAKYANIVANELICYESLTTDDIVTRLERFDLWKVRIVKNDNCQKVRILKK